MITSPPVLINNYLSDKLIEAFPNMYSANKPPLFLPTTPSNINAIDNSNADQVFAVYDRMFRLRRSPFPHCKKEQLLYYFYKLNEDPEELFEVIQVVYDIMDRGDESAQDLNRWVQDNTDQSTKLLTFGSGRYQKQFKPVFFYETKIFQLEESRDIEAFGSTSSFVASKMIINYDYHVQDYGNVVRYQNI